MSTVNQNAALSALFSLECSWLKDEERYYAENLLKEDVASDEDGMSEEDEEKEREPADIPTAELKPSNYRDLRVLRDVLTSMPTVNSKPEEAEEPAEAKDRGRPPSMHHRAQVRGVPCVKKKKKKKKRKRKRKRSSRATCALAPMTPPRSSTTRWRVAVLIGGNYEVHYDADGEQEDVYINNTDGRHHQRGMMLFYYEDLPDQFRLEDRHFKADQWYPMVYYA